MPYRVTGEEEVQAPIQIRVPSRMLKHGEEVDYWRLIADHFEELTRSCLFCSFTAKHRGSLKRHMVKMHSVK